VVDRFQGLRHDAVIRRDDEYCDVGHLRAARAHGGKRLVARRVDECDRMVVDAHLVGADVLRDAARLARGDARAPDGVQQARLAVVDVAKDCDDRRPRLKLRACLLFDDRTGALRSLLLLLRRRLVPLLLDRLEAQVVRDDGRRLEVDALVDGGHHAVLHQLLYHLNGGQTQEPTELLYGEDARQLDHARGAGRLRRSGRFDLRNVGGGGRSRLPPDCGTGSSTSRRCHVLP
jgi:hypothetical protein